jgi:hypothetical protein
MKFPATVVLAITAFLLASDHLWLDAPVAQAHSHPSLATPSCSDETLHIVQHENVADADVVKMGEHSAALQLVRNCEATHTALQSGPWSEPRTWQNREVPSIDAKIVIPKGVTVQVDAMLDQPIFDWIRVDGQLVFLPDRNTALAVRTLVIAEHGLLQIGAVGKPVRADVRAHLHFAPRTEGNRREDLFDLGGGLISLGVVQMVGASKTAHAPSSTPLRTGMDRLSFDPPPQGWQVGDQLLLPGTDAYNDEDEVRTITKIGNEGREIQFDRPLNFDHFAPDDIMVPVANLTRNIELDSMVAEPVKGRGHVMIMHVQTGTLMDGVAFLHLGRTDTHFAHTFPEIDRNGHIKPGTDANSIGRYAVHFHVRSGARASLTPHIVRNSVVIDSPKYGIVNHGAHVVAEDNITFRIAGAHFVAENGSEIGAFRRNVAVRSAGSGEAALENRMTIYDFGHGGHGFWLQSSAVELSDNWASGHARAGIFSMGMIFRENGKEVFFDANNTASSPPVDASGRVKSSDVTFHFRHNTVAGCGLGLEIWYHKLYSDYRELSVVDDLTVWNSLESAVSLLYARSVELRNLHLLGSGRGGIVGILSNDITESISIQDSDIRDFGLGIRLPERGHNLIRNTTLANAVNLEIPVALVRGRHVQLDNLSFDSSNYPQAVNLSLGDKPRYGDLSLLFEDDRIDLTDGNDRNYQVFFPFQRPTAIPFPDQGPEAIRGLTSAEIYKLYGLALGGALAPFEAVELPQSNAVLSPSPPPSVPYTIINRDPLETYPMQRHHFLSSSESGRWELLQSRETSGYTVVNVGKNPARFMLRRGLLPLQIHPDDVPYGYRVAGVMLERVDQQITMRTFEREFQDLKIDPDGFVRVAFKYANLAGTEIPYELALQVTSSAIRRGPNVDFWAQREFCGSCGRDTLQEDAQRFYETGKLDPMPPRVTDACHRWKESAVVLNRPFRRETGQAYSALLPELKDMADSMEGLHKSPFLLCENDKMIGQPHTDYDVIRRSGRGNFSHWVDALYFSSSDGSDPNTNNRQYSLVRLPN